MEDRQNNAPSHEKARSLAKRLEFGPAPFIVGLVVALVFGWWIFPELLFSRQDQPVQFSHETHLKDASLDCSVCHHLRADGTFDALPSTKDCAVCHSQMLGKSEAERVFFNEYVKKGKEVDWKVYQKQPDNVFFSHAVHSLATCNNCHEFSERELCSTCHLDMASSKKPPVFRENNFASLEKIFIEERIYKDKEFEQSKDMDAACAHIDDRLTPFYPSFIREVTKEDILKLMEIKMGRILKFNTDKADELIARMKEEIAEIDDHLAHIVDYTVNWYQMLKNKYGKNFPRRTELRNFDTIEAAKVVEANEKLYINRDEGFIGTALKKDEFVANCSDIDDVIVFFRDGKYIVTPVADKKFVGKNILYVNVFKKNDKRTIYNITYRDGKEGTTYIKRFAVTGVVRDREYDVTQGTPDSRITYFSANPNGEAEIIKVTLKPNPRVRRIIFERDFSEISIKGRQAQGVILTRLPVHKITLKQKGGSTLGGRKVWFDRDILRLNYDGRSCRAESSIRCSRS